MAHYTNQLLSGMGSVRFSDRPHSCWPLSGSTAHGNHGESGRADLYAGFCCRPPLPARAVATIHLGPLLPVASCDLPADPGEQPSRASCAVLLRAGFTEPRRSPAALVGSYPTLSPLPTVVRWAVCSLWHCPAGHPGWPLATALLCGARTFLSPWPPQWRSRVPRPPGRLVREDQHSATVRR